MDEHMVDEEKTENIKPENIYDRNQQIREDNIIQAKYYNRQQNFSLFYSHKSENSKVSIDESALGQECENTQFSSNDSNPSKSSAQRNIYSPESYAILYDKPFASAKEKMYVSSLDLSIENTQSPDNYLNNEFIDSKQLLDNCTSVSNRSYLSDSPNCSNNFSFFKASHTAQQTDNLEKPFIDKKLNPKSDGCDLNVCSMNQFSSQQQHSHTIKVPSNGTDSNLTRYKSPNTDMHNSDKILKDTAIVSEQDNSKRTSLEQQCCIDKNYVSSSTNGAVTSQELDFNNVSDKEDLIYTESEDLRSDNKNVDNMRTEITLQDISNLKPHETMPEEHDIVLRNEFTCLNDDEMINSSKYQLDTEITLTEANECLNQLDYYQDASNFPAQESDLSILNDQEQTQVDPNFTNKNSALESDIVKTEKQVLDIQTEEKESNVKTLSNTANELSSTTDPSGNFNGEPHNLYHLEESQQIEDGLCLQKKPKILEFSMSEIPNLHLVEYISKHSIGPVTKCKILIENRVFNSYYFVYENGVRAFRAKRSLSGFEIYDCQTDKFVCKLKANIFGTKYSLRFSGVLEELKNDIKSFFINKQLAYDPQNDILFEYKKHSDASSHDKGICDSQSFTHTCNNTGPAIDQRYEKIISEFTDKELNRRITNNSQSLERACLNFYSPSSDLTKLQNLNQETSYNEGVSKEPYLEIDAYKSLMTDDSDLCVSQQSRFSPCSEHQFQIIQNKCSGYDKPDVVYRPESPLYSQCTKIIPELCLGSIDILYETSFLERGKPRVFRIDINEITMINKKPYYNADTNSFSLNFNGRVTKPSVKNFQVIHPLDPTYITLTFGKEENDSFILDFTYPWSALNAFCVGLSSLDHKFGCD